MDMMRRSDRMLLCLIEKRRQTACGELAEFMDILYQSRAPVVAYIEARRGYTMK